MTNRATWPTGRLPSGPVSSVVIVGAGAAGLAAGRRLRDHGIQVRVIDKGRGLGGRLATRRVGEARIDHGAQFFTARSPTFKALVSAWVDTAVAYEWCQGFADRPDGHPRYAGTGGMTALAKDLAAGIEVATSTRVTGIRRHQAGWMLETTGGPVGRADAVILNPPAPQTLDLLSGVDAAPRALHDLGTLRYEPSMAALVVLDGPASLPSPGGIKIDDGPLSWVADNQVKGISAVPAVTIHGRGPWSQSVWARPEEEILATMLDAAGLYLGDSAASGTPHVQLQRWRYATPVTSHEQRCLVLVDGPNPLVAAGDAFGEAKVEGAVLSGWAAADEVLSRLL